MADHHLSVKAYRSLEQAAPLAAQLDALNLASRRPSPFDTFRYLQTFTAHDEYATPGQTLLFLVAFDGGSPVGYLPLRQVAERLLGVPYRSIHFLATHDNDRPRAIARPEDEARCGEAFYRYLVEVETGWTFLELAEQDAASKLHDPPAALDLRRYYLRRFPNNPNATLALPYRSLAEYLSALSHGRRKSLQHSVRKLFAAGELALVSSGDPRSLPALFDLYLDLERRSWKSRMGGHIGRHPQRIAFFRSLLSPEQPMQMFVHLVTLDGAPIAGTVTGAFAGRRYGFEEAFDEGYRDLAPGNAMMLLLVRDAIERGHGCFNLLGNYAYYKAAWLATITETESVQLFRKGSLVHVKALAGELMKRLRPPVTQREVDFNLERKEAPESGHEPSPAMHPLRLEERARAEAAFRALDAASANVERLGDEALRRALPFAIAPLAADASHLAAVGS
jgi:CelD/BcsL family acetyltransferase involved in cellulose biosynthesis